MKKLFLGSAFAACLMLLSSCLDGDGGNTRSRSLVSGVIRFDMKTFETVVDAPDFMPYSFYAKSLESAGYTEGSCILFNYDLDLDAPENSSTNVAAKGYYEGMMTHTPVDKYVLTSYMRDTTVLLENEQAIANPIDPTPMYRPVYLSGKLFLFSDFTYLTEQKTTWQMYYDSEIKSEEVNGISVYSLFLRATIKPNGEGKAPKIDGVVINAFDIERYIDQINNIERNNKKEEFALKINYINEIKEDSTFTWKAAEQLKFGVPKE